MRKESYKNYLLILLMGILAFNYVEHIALGLVLDNIKIDLHLTDSQLGLLSGIAFALFYALMGIPIARWADRGDRVHVISLTAVLWSVMLALCGMAASFIQLLIIRVGVAVGEAGAIPPAQSLIADYFGRDERPWAMSVYTQGCNGGLVIGYFLAGWLNEFFGWRMMFILLSLPGLALGILAHFSLREPRRQKRAIGVAGKVGSVPVVDQPGLREVLSTLWKNASFRHLLYAFSVWYFFGYGILQWQPTFFVRSFGLKTGELGTWFGVVYGLCGIVGTYLGGEWASRFAANNERLQLRAMAVVNVAFNSLLWSLIYFSQSAVAAFVLMGVSTLGAATINGPMLSTIQTLVSPRMRAMSIAIVLMFANLIGLGLGPLTVGVLSDALHPFFGQESLRWALLVLCPGYLWVSWHLFAASKTIDGDLEARSNHLEARFQS